MRSVSFASGPAAGVFGYKQPAKPVKKSGGIPPIVFYGTFGALALTNALTLMALLMAPDIATLIGGQNERLAGAYEDRLAQLRIEVDRLHSRQYAQSGDINLQLQELAQQQEELLEQHQLVKQLAQKAEQMGITTASLSPADADDEPAAGLKAAVADPSPSAPDLKQTAEAMQGMMDDGRLALAALTQTATKSTDTIVSALKPLGLRPKLPDDADADAVGGPYLPPVDGPDADSVLDDANSAYLALARLEAAQDAANLAPIHKPLTGAMRESSGFGNRTDPFTRGRAFHAGIDFAAPRGTTVVSAGHGTVTFVGQINGYGNVVEVTHAPGLVTRYGHLSAFIAKEGDTVEAGTPIARVGSTGRSTGPHLHFEVRRKDVAVDPEVYLNTGKRLSGLLGA